MVPEISPLLAIYVHLEPGFTVISEKNFLSLAMYPGGPFFRSGRKFSFPCLSYTFTSGDFLKRVLKKDLSKLYIRFFSRFLPLS